MSVMMRVSQMTREGHHGQVGGGLSATLAVTSVIFLGAPRPVVGHRRHWPPWPSIISYPAQIPKFVFSGHCTSRTTAGDTKCGTRFLRVGLLTNPIV